MEEAVAGASALCPSNPPSNSGKLPIACDAARALEQSRGDSQQLNDRRKSGTTLDAAARAISGLLGLMLVPRIEADADALSFIATVSKPLCVRRVLGAQGVPFAWCPLCLVWPTLFPLRRSPFCGSTVCGSAIAGDGWARTLFRQPTRLRSGASPRPAAAGYCLPTSSSSHYGAGSHLVAVALPGSVPPGLRTGGPQAHDSRHNENCC
jgi:hypothetical protein